MVNEYDNIFRILSMHIPMIANKLVSDQRIVKYLHYLDAKGDPQSKPDLVLPRKDFIETKVIPHPFSLTDPTETICQIRYYYPNAEPDDTEQFLDTKLFFEIVCSKDIWLIQENQQVKTRPYEIAADIYNLLAGQHFDGMGKLNFDYLTHKFVNEKCDILLLQARFVSR